MRLFCGLLRHPKLGCPPRKPGIVKGTVHAVFGRYLLVTNTITGGVLLAAGDMIQQEIERYRHKEVSKRMNRYDWPRVGRMFFAGLIQGPPQHYFYKKLDAVLPNRDWKSVCAKIFLDETVASPICIVLFFCGVGIFEKDAYSEIWSEIKSKFWTVYAADWLVWPPSQFINFYFVPPTYRLMYVNFVTTLYNVFLSYIKHEM
ncbi:mpv17-like protein 2 isoform X1 [Schistocerca piceifrons]|uniref:mpv17-like protein 2 isoform X1 n=1 Tax=Schistocerca piceifrons TaxID=274613 RepID=UPI001F5F083A|nr:mpv17-like protein 2 isoform X1 [Schistocerca piceifrons]